MIETFFESIQFVFKYHITTKNFREKRFQNQILPWIPKKKDFAFQL